MLAPFGVIVVYVVVSKHTKLAYSLTLFQITATAIATRILNGSSYVCARVCERVFMCVTYSLALSATAPVFSQ